MSRALRPNIGTIIGNIGTINETLNGRTVEIDVQKLIESRLLLQANSGGGKSWAIRRLLEQTHAYVPQLIIDVEGEFHTLREKFDYVLAGQKGGDCPADTKSAAMLARRLLELGVSAIIDIYELGVQRTRFVRLFLESLVNAPRELWKPTMVIVDEAHMFCPEQGSAESADAVKDLMTRGRKRGFCGVLATQRISKLHKDAAAEANNKLIGRSSLDIDMKRAGAELGFSKNEDVTRLRSMKPGTFYAFGPALTEHVSLIRVGDVLTTHPKAGERAMAPTPPSAKMKKHLAQLADLPQEAEEEARTTTELRAKVKQLEVELRTANNGVVEKVVEKLIVSPDQIKHLRDTVDRMDALRIALQRIADEDLSMDANTIFKAIAAATTNSPNAGRMPQAKKEAFTGTPPTSKPGRNPGVTGRRDGQPSTSNGEIGKAEYRLIESLAWWASIGVDPVDLEPFAFIAGYTVNGHFNNTRGKLRAAGLIEYCDGSKSTLTPEGNKHAPHDPGMQSLQKMHDKICAKLKDTQRRLFEPLLEEYPDSIALDALAERAGYTVNGHFNNMRGSLHTLGLVEYQRDSRTKACDWLFPEGLS